MGKQRWFLGCLCVVILGVSPWLALAQQPAPPAAVETQKEALEDIQLTRAVIQVERQAIVTQAMDLTPEEMETFWPLYREYRLEAVKIGDRVVALILRYAAAYDELTDATADKLVGDFVKIEQARANLKAKFLPRFKKVLPAKKVARFYQVENKLDIAILAEMADSIPLAR
jgi:hypothetical protein